MPVNNQEDRCQHRLTRLETCFLVLGVVTSNPPGGVALAGDTNNTESEGTLFALPGPPARHLDSAVSVIRRSSTNRGPPLPFKSSSPSVASADEPIRLDKLVEIWFCQLRHLKLNLERLSFFSHNHCHSVELIFLWVPGVTGGPARLDWAPQAG